MGAPPPMVWWSRVSPWHPAGLPMTIIQSTALYALTQTDHCSEAIPIMQLILTNIAEDQTAYYNATWG